MVVPTLYNMPNEQVIIQPDGKSICMAPIGCEANLHASVKVCADLPYNWMWDRYKGVIYMSVYNHMPDINNVS